MRHVLKVLGGMAVGAAVLSASSASAQTVVEAQVGRSAFIDDSLIHHTVIGVAARAYVVDQLALGASLTYMRGPGHDRDLLGMGHLSFDMLSTRARRRVTPYVSLGGGLMRHSNQFGVRGTVSHIGLTGALQLGARIRAGQRWFIAPEVGLGLEAHMRAGINIGVLR